MKSKAKKRLLTFGVILILAVLALPVTNLLYSPKSDAFATVSTSDKEFAAVLQIMSAKCACCHTKEGALPFYAGLPIARRVIERDIEQGTAYMDYEKSLATQTGESVGEVVLAKTEYVLEQGSMPPLRFKALHWTAGLDGREKAAILTWLHNIRRQQYTTVGVAPAYLIEPVQPLPTTVEVDAAKAALGDKLFHDKRLSKDDSVSCASCHALEKGGTDRVQFSTGVGGQVGGINSPTVYNSGFQFVQFWDGRAATLEEQADGPVNNPIEMASNWEEVFSKLGQDAAFVSEFTAVYPDGLTKENCTDAIAEFERTLVTPNSKFDRYLMGDVSALSADEKHGYKLFRKHGCAMCHVGKILGGQSFERMGRKADYFARRGAVTDADNGRFNVTKDEADRHAFKTPTLRNIDKTAPYLHDGSTSDLGEVVGMMAAYQMGTPLTPEDNAKIVAFLQTLTGEYKGQPLQ